MKKHIFIILASLIALSSCSHKLYLHRVNDNLTEQNNSYVFSGKIYDIAEEAGSIKLKSNDGEIFKGEWIDYRYEKDSLVFKNSLFAKYPDISNEEYFEEKCLLKGTLKGNKGSFLEIELIRIPSMYKMFSRGIAKDDKGNIYSVSSWKKD